MRRASRGYRGGRGAGAAVDLAGQNHIAHIRINLVRRTFSIDKSRCVCASSPGQNPYAGQRAPALAATMTIDTDSLDEPPTP